MDCMCRVCETIYGLKNMFDEENEELLLMLRSVANISIYPNDLLPKYICEFCSHRLQKSYEFKVQIETTDQKLREIVEHLTKHNIVASLVKTDNEQPVIKCKDQIKQEKETVTTNQQPTTLKSDTIVIIDSEDEETMKEFPKSHDESDEFSEEDEKEKIFEEEMKKLFGDVSILHRKKKSSVADIEPEITKVEVQVEEKVSEPKDDTPMTYQEIIISSENIDDLIIEDYSEDIEVNESAEKVENLEINSDVNNQAITKEERVVELVNDSTKKSSNNDSSKSNTPNQIIIKEPRIHKCAVCSEIFPNAKRLASHKRKHVKEGRSRCHICHKTFARKGGLKDHLLIHAGEKIPCDICGTKFSNRGNLLRHVQQCHNSVKRYQCDECGVYFARRGNMLLHKITHSEDRPYICDTCGKTFKTKLSLTIHGQRHLPIEERTIKSTFQKRNQDSKIYICPICGKKSKTVALHLTHMIIHNEVKPYECQECPKKFHFKQSLITHMLVHTGEKPYKCEICGKAFRQQPHVKTHHRAVHLGAKPYQCKYCQKCFTSAGTLKIHERLHTGERPFKCEQCGQCFIEKKALKKHTFNKCKGPASKPTAQSEQAPIENNADENSQTPTENMADESSYCNGVKKDETQEELQYFESALGAELEIYLQDIHNDYAEIIEVES